MSCSTGKRKRCSVDAHSGNVSENGLTCSTAHNGSGLPSAQDHEEERTCFKKRQNIPEGDVSSRLPLTSRYLTAVFEGSHWHAQESVKNIVIFGDSYSKLDHDETWVGHLERRLRNQSNEVEIHNFAFPGATVEDDFSKQLSHFFKLFPKKNSPTELPVLDANGTTYFIFMGINDCGQTDSYDLESIVECILDAVHELYVKAGARNFVFVNVPPIDHSPQALDAGLTDEMEERVKAWNESFQAQVTEFGASSKEATVLLFSSHQVFTEVLDDPLEFDFSEDDPTTEGGGIWVDDLHMTTEVHDIFAQRLLTSMFSHQ
ncbi:SGNH hydrolase-type esterase domain-containing protein [Pisolithus albus]|nr:SGNH hydrolase-type esterase domain-containing protein [Pisolithus albus]